MDRAGMDRRGRASAPAAGTILNAFATGTGAAFAIDRYATAEVVLTDAPTVTGEIEGAPEGDTRLVERCVELVVEHFANGESGAIGGTVRTESDVPMAAGLKSSSAAANAAVLATLDALDVPIVGTIDGENATSPSSAGGIDGIDGKGGVDDGSDAGDAENATGTSEYDRDERESIARVDACRLGVRAAREVGVTVTGAFDDASASMLGGVTVTDNTTDELLAYDREFERAVLVWTPPEAAYSADADRKRCQRIAPVAEVVAEHALGRDYERAMTTNGFAYCGALGYDPEPMIEALEHVRGVSLSGTGPSVVAVGEREVLTAVRGTWNDREGTTWLTETRTTGARTR